MSEFKRPHNKMLVVLSGGQDSTTCLHWAFQQARHVEAIVFDYVQRHVVELHAAEIACMLTQIPLTVVRLPHGVLQSTSPLVSGEKLEQYADWTQLPGGLEKTFVPMRNQLFLTLAANRAVAMGCDQIVTGVCEEDFGGYPDCRQTFILAVEAAIRLGTFLDPAAQFKINTPLMNLSKAKSVELALSLPGCYGALGFSHTAYDGLYPPTGHDHASLLRAKGFDAAGVPDPLVVRAYWEGRMGLPETESYMRHVGNINKLHPRNPHLDTSSWHYIEFLAARLNSLQDYF